jgi:starvation-inducible DNA-binding protein
MVASRHCLERAVDSTEEGHVGNDKKIVAGLNRLLADSTVFYQKLRHYHWNVDGRHFFELHGKFEELYERWAGAIDEIAERILMLGETPLHTLQSLLAAARLDEDETTPAADAMVDAVVADLEALHGFTGGVIEAAESAGDRGTANLLDDLRDGMEKDVWMLRAWRQESARSWS